MSDEPVDFHGGPTPAAASGCAQPPSAGESAPADSELLAEIDRLQRDNRSLRVNDERSERFVKEMVIQCADSLGLAANIDILKGTPGSGDSVTVTSDKDGQQQVICSAHWTGFEDRRFYGDTLLAALRKAAEAQRTAGGVK